MSFRPPVVYPLIDSPRSDTVLPAHADPVAPLLRAGLGVVQMRPAETADADRLPELVAAAQQLRAAGGLLIVHDRLELTRLCRAGGLHLAEGDIAVAASRGALGPAAVIGWSSGDAASARAGEEAGADYVSIGPIYPTGTGGTRGKPGGARPALGLAAVRAVRAAVELPLVAMGGITLERARSVLDAGADSLAVASDIFLAQDPASRAAEWARSYPDLAPLARGLVFLTGFMGAGKSTVGALLAARLGRRFVDLDGAIEAAAGMTIPEIFRTQGEEAFRIAEAQALDRLPGGVDAVVALGGGALMPIGRSERVRGLGRLIWLDAPLQSLLERCGEQGPPGQRPLLAEIARARELLAARLPGYQGAEFRICVQDREPEAVVEEIVRALA